MPFLCFCVTFRVFSYWAHCNLTFLVVIYANIVENTVKFFKELSRYCRKLLLKICIQLALEPNDIKLFNILYILSKAANQNWLHLSRLRV